MFDTNTSKSLLHSGALIAGIILIVTLRKQDCLDKHIGYTLQFRIMWDPVGAPI